MSCTVLAFAEEPIDFVFDDAVLIVGHAQLTNLSRHLRHGPYTPEAQAFVLGNVIHRDFLRTRSVA